MNNLKMSAVELNRTNIQVDESNKKLGKRKTGGMNSLGKDSFLKLLVTELRHQDPTKPMEDKAFIAQMAQFSSLEQMTNIKKEITNLNHSSKSHEAFSLLGKNISAFNPRTKSRIDGQVTSIQFLNNQLKIMVGKKEVSMKDINSVYNSERNYRRVK